MDGVQHCNVQHIWTSVQRAHSVWERGGEGPRRYPEDKANDAEKDARVGAVEQLEERAQNGRAQLSAHLICGPAPGVGNGGVASVEMRRQLHDAEPRERLEQRRRRH